MDFGEDSQSDADIDEDEMRVDRLNRANSLSRAGSIRSNKSNVNGGTIERPVLAQPYPEMNQGAYPDNSHRA